MISYKSRREIELMWQAGQVLARLFDKIEPTVKAGVTTEKLDQNIHQWMLEEDTVPAFLGYREFPAVACISINEEVVHGIPSPSRVLKDGDLVTFDIGVIWKGYYSDAARTYGVGELDPAASKLLETTRESLERGIAALRTGGRLSEIGAAVQENAEGAGFSVVRDFVGHGIGRELHEDPQVPNYVSAGVRRRDMTLKKGLVLAIEPMLNAGSERVRTMEDGWTVVTQDQKLSAHFEDSIALTADGPVILTRHPSD